MTLKSTLLLARQELQEVLSHTSKNTQTFGNEVLEATSNLQEAKNLQEVCEEILNCSIGNIGQTKKCCTAQAGPTRWSSSSRNHDEFSFKVMCAPFRESSLPDIGPSEEYQQSEQYPVSLPLSDLRHYPHEDQSHHEVPIYGNLTHGSSGGPSRPLVIRPRRGAGNDTDAAHIGSSGLKYQTTMRLAIRTMRASPNDLARPDKSTTQHAIGVTQSSTIVSNNVTVTGYIAVFHDLVNGLFASYTRGKFAKGENLKDQPSLTRQALTYLILSDLGIAGIDGNATSIYVTHHSVTSQLHEQLMPLLRNTATREPSKSWVVGLNNLKPDQLEARVQAIHWFMSICRKTLERLELQQPEEGDIRNRLKCLLRVGHDSLRMQAQRYQAGLPHPEIIDGLISPSKEH